MGCPSCGAENPSEARFCNACGAPQAAICPSCGNANPPGSRFCNACGNPLAAPAPTQQEATPSPQSYTPRHLAERILSARANLEGERKHVTVLFADIKGSTELIEGLDPEAAQAILAPSVSAMIEAVHRFEGTVCRVMGDGIMALFGAPLAHEDHAARACYAALTMQDGIRRYGEQTRARDGIEVQARVGLNSGEVVVGSISNDLHVEYTAIGPTVHLAARMEQLAREGTIRLTAETLRLAEGLVEVNSLGRIPVRGIAEPVEAFELTGAGRARRRFQAAAERGLTRFVGRRVELSALQRALDQAQVGHGQVVAPVGEPGVGKSRLFHEFVHSHRTVGWTVLESGSVSYGRATLWLPVIDLLKLYCRIEPSDDARTAREKVIGKLLSLDRALESILTPLLALLDLPLGGSDVAEGNTPEQAAWAALDSNARRRATLDAVRRLLLRESQEQPLLLVFEDLHWIDSETQALLDSLVEALPTSRILLLVNYRPEYIHTWGNKSYYTQLRIDPLGEASAEELLDALLGGDPSAQALKALLISRTAGNPFFLEESVRALVETGALAGERGAYRLSRSVSDVQVPATVQSVLAARIDRLPPEQKRMLQIAAVIGKDVPFILLQAIAETPDSDLQVGLSALQAAELVYAVSLFPELELTFKHALTHEVAYGSLLQERRRELHGRIVEAIQGLYADRLDEQIERLAHHAARGAIWDLAAIYCRQAGVRAHGRSAFANAVDQFEQALAALGNLPASRAVDEQAVDIRRVLHGALRVLGERERALETLREEERLAKALGDQRRLIHATFSIANTHWTAGEYEQAIEIAQRAVATAEALDDVQLKLIAHIQVALPSWGRGDYRGSADHFKQSIASLDDELLLQHPRETTGHEGIISLANIPWCLAELGDFAEGRVYEERAIRLAEQTGVPYTVVVTYARSSHLALRQGQASRTIAQLERGVEIGQRHNLALNLPSVSARLGAAYLQAGRLQEALSLLEEAVGDPEAVRPTPERSSYLAWLGEAYLLAGRHEDAEHLAARALAVALAQRGPGNEAWARHLLGEIASQAGRSAADEAEQQYRGALALGEELGMRPLQARCHLGLGKLYRRTGRSDEARAELATAVEMLREMGMAFWLPEAEGELAEAGETSRAN